MRLELQEKMRQKRNENLLKFAAYVVIFLGVLSGHAIELTNETLDMLIKPIELGQVAGGLFIAMAVYSVFLKEMKGSPLAMLLSAFWQGFGWMSAVGGWW